MTRSTIWSCHKCGAIEEDYHDGSYPPPCDCREGVKIDLDRIVPKIQEIINREVFHGRNVVRVVPVDNDSDCNIGKS